MGLVNMVHLALAFRYKHFVNKLSYPDSLHLFHILDDNLLIEYCLGHIQANICIQDEWHQPQKLLNTLFLDHMDLDCKDWL